MPPTRSLSLAIMGILLYSGVSLDAQSSGMKITSPANGTIVTAGQSITVTITALGSTVLQNATAWILPLGQIPQVIQSPPFQVAVAVPSGQIGTLPVVALASDSQGNTLQDSVSVIVAPTSPATSIKVNPNRVLFSSVNGTVMSVNVSATFQDGTSGYVTSSPDTQYTSSNTKVAVVNSSGQVQAVAPGMSNLTISYAGFNATIPVTVGVFPLKGDLNGDGAVDLNDIQILLKALNTASTGSGDPRDLNNDGKIDALDARILATLCSRPACATH